jgi:AcrR family transcriptional regulator
MNESPTAPTQASPSGNAEAEILRLAREAPELGQLAVADRLRDAGIRISPSGVRYLWQKHGLETTAKRLQALVRQNEEGAEALTETQRRHLERSRLSARLARGDGIGAGGGDDEPLERRRVILNAAAELFADHGYDRTSIRDIARRVGLLPGSVYHYFPSKEELFLAVHREGFERTLARVKKAAASCTDPWECLRRACEVHIEGIVGDSPVDRIAGHSLALTGHAELLTQIRPQREAYEKVFKTLVDALPLRPGTDRSLLRLFLLGGMNWVYLWYREGKRTARDIADAMVEMLRTGVEA